MEVFVHEITSPRNDTSVPNSYPVPYCEICHRIYITLSEFCRCAISDVESTPLFNIVLVLEYQLAADIEIGGIVFVYKSHKTCTYFEQAIGLYILQPLNDYFVIR